jgi:3-phenylpropionate/trans-cinnamate dioxygenase ferredoxin component
MPIWTHACAASDIEPEDLIRFDHGARSFIVVRSPDDTFHALDGHCSHDKVHLCDGLAMDYGVECPKHSGVFDYRTGEAIRAPACINLRTYPVRVENGHVFIEVSQ